MLLVLRLLLAPVLWCPWCSVPVGRCVLPGASPCPLAARLSFANSLSSVLLVGRWRGLLGADGQCPGVGGLEPPAEGLGGVGAAEALVRVPEQGVRCRPRHGGLRGGLLAVDGGAGEDFLEGVDHACPPTPARPAGPIQPAAGGGGGLRARGPGAAVAGAGGGGCVWVAQGNEKRGAAVGGGGRGHQTAVAREVALWGAGAPVAGPGGGRCVSLEWRMGSAVPFMGGGHGTMVARVVALRGAGTAGAGPWGVVAALRGAGAVRVRKSGAVTLRGAGEPWEGALLGGGAGAPPFRGSGRVVGQVEPLERHK